jgi:hypothetical protein
MQYDTMNGAGNILHVRSTVGWYHSWSTFCVTTCVSTIKCYLPKKIKNLYIFDGNQISSTKRTMNCATLGALRLMRIVFEKLG